MPVREPAVPRQQRHQLAVTEHVRGSKGMTSNEEKNKLTMKIERKNAIERACHFGSSGSTLAFARDTDEDTLGRRSADDPVMTLFTAGLSSETTGMKPRRGKASVAGDGTESE